MGIINRKTYLIIALGIAIIIFLVATFFGDSIAVFADSLPGMVAVNVRSLAAFIIEPIKWVMLNPVPGAIVTGLLWPLSAFWVILMLFLIILTALGQVQTDIEAELMSRSRV